METQIKFGVLKMSEFFNRVRDADLRTLAESMNVEFFKQGDTLFRADEVADRVFVVMSGDLGVFLGKAKKPARHMGPGDVIGEYALFTGETRSATVKCTSDVVLLSLDNRRFLEFLKLFPNITIALLEQTVHRLLALEGRLRETGEPDRV
jgi:CRP-like cAMP-binding protein